MRYLGVIFTGDITTEYFSSRAAIADREWERIGFDTLFFMGRGLTRREKDKRIMNQKRTAPNPTLFAAAETGRRQSNRR